MPLTSCSLVSVCSFELTGNNNNDPIHVGCSYLNNTQSMRRLSAQPVPSLHSICYMFGNMSWLYHMVSAL
jgi:hypothetical protein